MQGIALVMDGWQDQAKKPLLNFLAVTSKGGRFIKSVDTAGKCKTADYLVEQLEAVIKEIGVENVQVVITDNAANCKRAGEIIHERYVGTQKSALILLCTLM